MEHIKMPIYYWEDEETKEKHYDLEEMANELESRICKALNRNVLITISEVDDLDDEDHMTLDFNPTPVDNETN